jgi:NADPH:quinone reductase-like Zn-dependent oxidoreductase
VIEQHNILTTISEMVDSGKLRSTHTETLGKINAENLRRAHQLIESGRTVGKITLAGFD